MRGTRVEVAETGGFAGIIPAYAGNTNQVHPLTHDIRDHPRVCGEHGSCSVSLGFELGSSPRMRGTRANGLSLRDTCGIIPAYAGNTVGM